MEPFETRRGAFALERHPGRPSVFRGWNAADRLVVTTLEERDDLDGLLSGERPVVVVNPGAGAVPIALAAGGAAVTIVGDSFMDVSATLANAEANGIDPALIAHREPAEFADGPSPRAVVVGVPKRLALLEAQLAELRPVLAPDTFVVGAGMTRHVHSSTIEAFERAIGPTTTSLAVRKARLLFATVEATLEVAPPPSEVTYRAHGLTLVNDPNGFSPRRVDAGTELLLAALGEVDLGALRSDDGALRVADVGCGNGVIGAWLLARVPDSRVLFVDESYGAVRSARRTVEVSVPERLVDAEFAVGDALRSFDGAQPPEPGTLDLVVSNPPFHDDHAVTDEIAWGIFTSAHRRLRPGGGIVIVGNRHLNYHVKLKRLFGDVVTLRSNSRFVVLAATRR